MPTAEVGLNDTISAIHETVDTTAITVRFAAETYILPRALLQYSESLKTTSVITTVRV